MKNQPGLKSPTRALARCPMTARGGSTNKGGEKMPFTDHKLETFTRKISDLPDEPKLLPNELKAYFDSSPEELREAHNDLCESLDEIQANAVHFTMTAGVPEENVQDAIVNVQAQLKNAIDGSIPSGSIDGDKLAQDVRDRFSAIENAATTEANTRASADTNLQNQINTPTSQIASLSANKCEIYTGQYTGNGAATQDINLGFQPKAVLVMYMGFVLEYGFENSRKQSMGGMATPNWDNAGIKLTSTGFQVQHDTTQNPETGMDRVEVNLSGFTYVYLAFK